MDKIKLYRGLVLLLIVTTACQQNRKFEAEINKVDSLQQVVKNLKMTLDSVDESAVETRYPLVEKQKDFLTNNYPDSTDRRFWISDMGYLNQVHQGLSQYKEYRPEVEEELEYSEEQLEGLRYSLADEKLTEEQAEKYLEQETEALRETRNNVYRLVPATRNAIIIWDSLQPRFDSIANYLRNRS